MPKPKSTAKLVITSVVISFAVIAIFALIFLNYIVPTYQVTEEQIYSVLIKLFPVLIGLILIQIGVMIAKRNEDEFKDQVDKLPPNAYTKPFEAPAKDDPMNVSIDAAKAYDQVEPKQTAAAGEIIREVPVVKEVIREVPVEVIKEIEKEVPVVREVIREVRVSDGTGSAQPERIEVPVEVIKEVPVEVVKEVEKIVEVPVEVIKEVIREVPSKAEDSTAAAGAQIKEIIKEIPIEIIKEVPIEVPVEKIVEKEVPVERIVEKEVPVQAAEGSAAETKMLGFEEVLAEECREANELGNDITLVLIRKTDSISENVLCTLFSSNAFIFDRDKDYALIFSFANEEETASMINAKESRLKGIEFSCATLSGSQADAASLVRMAEAGL